MSATIRELARLPAPFRFAGLPSYTRDEVAVWNWFHRFFRGEADWRAWIQDAWHELLHVPAGFEISLSSKNTADAQQEPARQAFKQREIFIGRETDNDVKLPTLAVGKRHARIFIENGQCFLEDLGTSLGTYLNQNKLSPKQPYAVNAGDQIAIFPYAFTLSLRQLWAPELTIGIHSGASESMTWLDFLHFAPKGRTTFPLQVHPIRGAACLDVNRAFLVDLIERFLRPLDLQWPPSTLASADSGFVEFVIVSLLERVNRDLAFPFQFETGACGSKPSLPLETRGIVMTCSLSLLATTGSLRLFVPFTLLEQMQRIAPTGAQNQLPPSVAWRFPVSVGSQPLTVSEAAGLERNDVLLFRPRLELLMAGAHDRGWSIRDATASPSSLTPLEALRNIKRIQIDNYFERDLLISGDSEPGETPHADSTPDLGHLPLQVHIIVAEKELTLSEANGLAAGTILSFDRPNDGHVLLAVNGKILGEGQLVEVEGRLGVKISAWRQT